MINNYRHILVHEKYKQGRSQNFQMGGGALWRLIIMIAKESELGIGVQVNMARITIDSSNNHR